jgi:hypothetical protein
METEMCYLFDRQNSYITAIVESDSGTRIQHVECTSNTRNCFDGIGFERDMRIADANTRFENELV